MLKTPVRISLSAWLDVGVKRGPLRLAAGTLQQTCFGQGSKLVSPSQHSKNTKLVNTLYLIHVMV
jgi:hypothetical protein